MCNSRCRRHGQGFYNREVPLFFPFFFFWGGGEGGGVNSLIRLWNFVYYRISQSLLTQISMITTQISGPYYMESLVQPDKRLKVMSEGQGQEVKVTTSGQTFYHSTPGLSGDAGTFSISTADTPSMHLCISATSPLKVTILDRYNIKEAERAKLLRLCSFKVRGQTQCGFL